MANLLSENDLRALKTAMDTGKPVEMTRCLGGVTITAKTIRAGPPWTVPMILQVRREAGNVVTMQNLSSVEEFRRLWRER